MDDKTILYYNHNATEYVKSTVNADMSNQYSAFLKYLSPGAFILDLGCGSGRDSRYFIEQGYRVEAVDGSPELCIIASEYIKQPVRNLMFQDLDYTNIFDAVWACSTLLHLDRIALLSVMKKISIALKDDAILYVSFKYGSHSGDRNGRFFLDLTENAFIEIVEQIKAFHVLDLSISNDVRPNRGDEKWLNALLCNSYAR